MSIATELSHSEVLMAAHHLTREGGHFASCIGKALMYADDTNMRRLLVAFGDLIEEAFWKEHLRKEEERRERARRPQMVIKAFIAHEQGDLF